MERYRKLLNEYQDSIPYIKFSKKECEEIIKKLDKHKNHEN